MGRVWSSEWSGEGEEEVMVFRMKGGDRFWNEARGLFLEWGEEGGSF